MIPNGTSKPPRLEFVHYDLNHTLWKVAFTAIESNVDAAITVPQIKAGLIGQDGLVVNRHASIHDDEPIVSTGADGFT